MMRRVTLVLVAVLLALPAHAGFNEVLGGLRSRLGEPTWIPFLSVVRTVVRVGHPRGVHDLQLAMYEGRGAINPSDLEHLMRSQAGRDYAPLVNVRSRRGNESSFIYARPVGDLLELLVLTSDNGDTVLVRVVVDPAMAGQYLKNDPRSVALVARH